MFAGKGIDLCNPADPICHAGPGNEWSGHTDGYVPGYTTQAAAFVASKLLAGTGEAAPGLGPPTGYGQLPAYDTSLPGPTTQVPIYATQPRGSDHMPPGWDESAPGFDPSSVTGLP
jgi:cutinase